MKNRLLPATLLVFQATAATPGLDPAALKRIPAYIQSAVDKGEIAGVVTLVARNGEIGALDATGWADIEQKKPMKPDTIFQIMSQTKSVTGVAAMILVDEGKLNLKRPVQDYLPEFKGIQVAEKQSDGTIKNHPPKHPPTVWELMSHTSGLGFLPATGDFARINYTMARTLADAVQAYSQERLNTEPGTKYFYSNMGIATVGRIVEVLSGMPYERFVETRILQPLGMKDTFYFPPEDKKSRIAMVYMEDHGKLTLARDKAQGGDPALYRPNAKYPGPELALFSTASDLFRFYQMLANKGTYGGKRILSPQAVEAMLHDYTPDHSNYGLTVNVMEAGRPQLNLINPGTFGHGGAFATGGWVDPKTGLVIVLLAQHMGANGNWIRDAFWQLAEGAVR